MKVRWLAGKKAGTISHVPLNDNAIATMLEAGMCEQVSDDAANSVPGIPDALLGSVHTVAPFTQTVLWSVRSHPNGMLNEGAPCIVKQIASEFTWYRGPEKDTPQEIVDQFIKATENWRAKKKADLEVRLAVERGQKPGMAVV